MAKEKDNIADALHAMTNGDNRQPSIHSTNPAQSMPVPNPQPQPVARKRATAPGQESTEISDPQPVTMPAPIVRKASPVKYTKAGSIAVRQTLIPSCLVAGVILTSFCAIYYLQPESAPIRYLGSIWPITIGIVGVVVLGMGIMNMRIVKSQLTVQKPRS